MTFPAASSRALDARYRTFGRQAVWTPAAGGSGVGCLVRRLTSDEEAGWGGQRALARRIILKVRVSQVPAPASGDLVAVETFGAHKIIAQPVLSDHGQEWICEAAPV